MLISPGLTQIYNWRIIPPTGWGNRARIPTMENVMNIKRAFLAAASVLMVPGFAWAQGVTTHFDTQVKTTNGADVTINAALVCNTGNPLTQDQDISPGVGNGVDFVVQEMVIDENTTCGITFSTLPTGYEVLSIETSGAGSSSAPHCRWNTNPDDSPVNPEGNFCYVLLAPAPIQYTMNKVWEFSSDVDVSQQFSMQWTCNNVMTATDDTTPGSVSSSWGAVGDASITVSNLYANPAGGTFCYAMENVVDSAVESDQGCMNGVYFAIGDGEKECTVTNTVFFEGIPTLSQYGLAILAVLMLGVGFVGFRRFV